MIIIIRFPYTLTSMLLLVSAIYFPEYPKIAIQFPKQNASHHPEPSFSSISIKIASCNSDNRNVQSKVLRNMCKLHNHEDKVPHTVNNARYFLHRCHFFRIRSHQNSSLAPLSCFGFQSSPIQSCWTRLGRMKNCGRRCCSLAS